MRKIITVTMLVIMLISSFYSCFAFEIGNREVYSKGECERLLTYNGIKVITTYVVYNKDGVEYPAYCLDVTKPGAEEGNYILHAGSKVQNQDVWRAIVNGYPYKTLAELGAANEGEAYTATKHAVYTLLYNRNVNEYGPINSDAGRRTYEIYKNIVNAARSSSETMVTDIITSLSTNDVLWKIDEKDNRYVSKTFKLNSTSSNGRFDIHCDRVTFKGMRITDLNNVDKTEFPIGENFKILIPIETMKEDGSFEIVARTILNTRPVAYGSTTVPGKQDYALTGYQYEEQYTGLVQEYYKNLTKIKILKREYNSDKVLAGVKFNLLNDKKEIVYENLVTDKNGKIVLENMMPGKYYLEEKETIEGYALYSDLIEIGLDYNEEFDVIVNNKKKEVAEYVKDYEVVEVTPSRSETTIIENSAQTDIKKNEEIIDVKEEIKNKEDVTNITQITEETTIIEEKVEENITKTNIVENIIEGETVENKVEVKEIKNVKKLPKTGY